MAGNQAGRATKDAAGQPQPGKQQVANKKPKQGKPAKVDNPFKLSEATEYLFQIGGGTVTVVLLGTGLDTAGLNAVVLRSKGKGYEKLAEDDVLIEQPGSDETNDHEFPISIKVLGAPPGYYYFAIELTMALPGVPPVTARSVLAQQISFVT